MKKGICKNIGPCTKANSEEVQEIIDDFAPFECLECGQLLNEVVDEKPKRKLPKWVLPTSSGIVLLILIFIFVTPLLKEKSSNKKIETNKFESTGSISKPSDSIVVDKPETKEPVPSEKEEIKKSVPVELIASSLEDGLQKIGNTQYSQESRKALSTKILAKFENRTVPVKVLMNNNEYEYFTIDKYLNRILIQGIKNISVKEEIKNNSGLISELNVNE